MVADDHPVYRDALSHRLRQEFCPSLEIASVASYDEVLRTLQASSRQWVVLLDLLMPGVEGMQCLRQLRERGNVDHVVALSGLDEKTWEPRVLDAGASLFMSKINSADTICSRLQQLFGGDARLAGLRAEEPPDCRLTSRQQQVLSLIGEGYPNKIIADRLQITEQTVKLHVKQIFRELRVYNRTQGVLRAQKLQML